MESNIAKAEAEHARLQALTEDPKLLADHQKSKEAFEKLATAQQEVERLYARWAELEAKTA
jgi:ATP-binding cassette subfamily F protein uup